MTDREQQIAESRRWGRMLAQHFAVGHAPTVKPSPIALVPGEQYFGTSEVYLFQYTAGDGSYLHTSTFALGGIGFMAASYGLTAIMNGARRRRAERDAQPQWRPIGGCRLHLTGSRIALQGLEQWVDIPFDAVRASDCDSEGVTLEIAGWPPTRLVGGLPDYWFTLFRKLAYDEVVEWDEPAVHQVPLALAAPDRTAHGPTEPGDVSAR